MPGGDALVPAVAGWGMHGSGRSSVRGRACRRRPPRRCDGGGRMATFMTPCVKASIVASDFRMPRGPVRLHPTLCVSVFSSFFLVYPRGILYQPNLYRASRKQKGKGKGAHLVVRSGLPWGGQGGSEAPRERPSFHRDGQGKDGKASPDPTVRRATISPHSRSLVSSGPAFPGTASELRRVGGAARGAQLRRLS